MSTRKIVSQKKPIDWRELKQRLDAGRIATEQIWAPVAENVSRILQSKAQTLASEALPVEAASASIEVIEFILAHERYAVASEHVREVCPLGELTPLPCTPAYVLGIINLHGKILSVIDIKRFFDLPEKGTGDLNKVIVLESEVMEFCILADVISGVRRILSADIKSILPTLTGIRESYLLGVTTEHLMILNAKKLLNDESLIVQEEVEPTKL